MISAPLHLNIHMVLCLVMQPQEQHHQARPFLVRFLSREIYHFLHLRQRYLMTYVSMDVLSFYKWTSLTLQWLPSRLTIFLGYVTMPLTTCSGAIHPGRVIGRRMSGCSQFIGHRTSAIGCFASSTCLGKSFISSIVLPNASHGSMM
jgi:hypothetical protein